jgi:hypothetical protein
MTFGDIKSNWGSGILVAQGFASIAGFVTTTSGTLVDVTGLSFSITLPAPGDIWALFNLEAQSTGGSGAILSAWAVSINAADQTERQRYLSGTNDRGLGGVAGRVSLGAGTYTVTARHRRVSGASTLNTMGTLTAFGFVT